MIKLISYFILAGAVTGAGAYYSNKSVLVTGKKETYYNNYSRIKMYQYRNEPPSMNAYRKMRDKLKQEAKKRLKRRKSRSRSFRYSGNRSFRGGGPKYGK